jgi:uroporphyrinogen decarboxylase
LRRTLGVDFRGMNAPFVGKKKHADIRERGIRVDPWGVHSRWVEHESGGYWDFCEFPLQNADEEAVARWPMPSPDDYDYSRIPALCEAAGNHALYAGGAGMADVINGNGRLRGMEQTLVDLITDDPAGRMLTERMSNIQIECLRRTIEAAGGRIDFLWIGEDLGTQKGPIIGMDLYRRALRPVHQRFIDLAAGFGIPVMVHTCGSSSWVYEDFIEMGVSAVDTLQPEAANMSPEYLKKTFGGRLSFHGCISTAGPVVWGTVAETEEYCRRTLEIMMPGGGYMFAPTHQLQDNSRTENVVAMYRVAREAGVY